MSIKLNNYYLPIAFMLSTSMQYMSYYIENTLIVTISIFMVLLVIYFMMPKIKLTNKRHVMLYKIMVVFGLMYLLRAFIDVYIIGVHQILFTNDSTAIFYVFNAILVPLVALTRGKFQGKFTWVFLFTAIMLILSLFYSLQNFLHGNVQQTNDLRIGANDSLGVIEYGHLGLTATIMGVTLLLKRKENRLFKYSSLVLIPIGIVSIFLAGTRSAMVGAVVIFTLFVLSSQKRKVVIPFLLLIASLVVFSESIINFAESFDAAGPVIRIYRLINEEGDQSSGRTIIWLYALNQISDLPLFGVSCFFQTFDTEVQYIHNSFIEVFYAIGIFGFVVFVIMNFVAIKTSIRIFRSDNADMKCFAFLYLQYFVYSLFSDTILRLNLFWFFLAVVLCIHFNGLVDKKKKVPKYIETKNTEQSQFASAPVQQLDTQAL